MKRMINTRIWHDAFFERLQSDEKLVFLYLLTSPYTQISGVLEVTPERIAFETGVEVQKVKEVLSLLEANEKIKEVDGFIYIKNFIKHQSLNESVKTGIKRTVENIPEQLKAEVLKDIDSSETFEVIVRKGKKYVKIRPKRGSDVFFDGKTIYDTSFTPIDRKLPEDVILKAKELL